MITLVVPARREALGVLRIIAGNAARLSGFDYDRVEEARLAVNEAASLLIADGRSTSVRCVLEPDSTVLDVELEADPGPVIWPPEPWVDTLEHAVLVAVTDGFELLMEKPPRVRLSLGPSTTH